MILFWMLLGYDTSDILFSYMQLDPLSLYMLDVIYFQC